MFTILAGAFYPCRLGSFVAEEGKSFRFLDALPSPEDPFVSHLNPLKLMVSKTASSNFSFRSLSHSSIYQMSQDNYQICFDISQMCFDISQIFPIAHDFRACYHLYKAYKL